MTALRKFSIAAFIAFLLVAAVGILAVANELWVLATLMGYLGLMLTVVAILYVSRHVLRVVRTGGHNSKLASQRVAARLKETAQRQDAALAELRKSVKSTNKSVGASITSSEGSAKALDAKIAKLDQDLTSILRDNARNVRSTVRDSTQQVEAMIQLYGRYQSLKLPMPNTGGFAIDAQALAHLVTLVEDRKPMKIVELGSGTSTIWLGYLCQAYGGKLLSLDHLEHYLALTQSAIQRHELEETVECRLAPLEETESDGRVFNWYSADALADQSEIDLLIADGPPQATGPQARYPSLPKLISRLSPNAMVILDDAHRKDEAEIVKAWLDAFPEFQRIEHGTSRLAVLERKA